MALVATELLNSVRTSADFQKKGQMSRRFIVTTRDPLAARQADGVPTASAPHPLDPTYKCDLIETTPTGAGHTYVDATYSNDRSTTFRQPNRDDPSWYHWGWSQRDVEVAYYVNVRVPMFFSDEASSVLVWELQAHKLLETRLVRPLYVRLERVTDPRWLDPIARQKNKIHLMPDGKQYRFLGGQVSQKDDTSYDITYEWELDEGTPLPRVLYAPDNSAVIATYPSAGVLRNPYATLITIASPNPRTHFHSVAEVYPYTEDDYGYRELPGAIRVG